MKYMNTEKDFLTTGFQDTGKRGKMPWCAACHGWDETALSQLPGETDAVTVE